MEIFGARNPYAIAELLSNTKIDWTKVDHRSTLEGILGMEYAELFDPDVSPLFRALNSFQTPISTETRICRKAVSMNCGFMIPQETIDQINYYEERNSIAFDGNTKLDDVIQGVLPDCFLIASISAIQASDPEYFPSRLITQMDPLTGKKYLIIIVNRH